VDPLRRIVHNVRKGRKLLAMARWRRALTARRVCLLPRALAHFEAAVVRRALAAWKEQRIEAVVLQLMAKEMQNKVREPAFCRFLVGAAEAKRDERVTTFHTSVKCVSSQLNQHSDRLHLRLHLNTMPEDAFLARHLVSKISER
jgi:hypothetical protein